LAELAAEHIGVFKGSVRTLRNEDDLACEGSPEGIDGRKRSFRVSNNHNLTRVDLGPAEHLLLLEGGDVVGNDQFNFLIASLDHKRTDVSHRRPLVNIASVDVVVSPAGRADQLLTY